jgi:hypothetical protein
VLRVRRVERRVRGLRRVRVRIELGGLERQLARQAVRGALGRALLEEA